MIRKMSGNVTDSGTVRRNAKTHYGFSQRPRSCPKRDLHELRFQAAIGCFLKLFVTPEGEPKSSEFALEGIADQIGLRLSHGAYRWYTHRKEAALLPMKSLLEPKQLFFVNWAYAQCYAETNFKWLGRRSPPRFHRVNRGLSMYKPFIRAFSCGVNDHMMPILDGNLLRAACCGDGCVLLSLCHFSYQSPIL